MPKPLKEIFSFIVIPAILGVILVVASTLFVHDLTERREADRQQLDLDLISGYLEAGLLTDKSALLAIKADRLADTEFDENTFNSNASVFHENIPSLILLQFVDESNSLFSYPLEHGEYLVASDMKPGSPSPRARYFMKAKDGTATAISPPFLFEDNVPAIAMFEPVYKKGSYLGTVIGVVRLHNVLRDSAKVSGAAAQQKVLLSIGDRIISAGNDMIYTLDGKRIIDSADNAVLDPSSPRLDEPGSESIGKTFNFGGLSLGLHLVKKGLTIEAATVAFGIAMAGLTAAMIAFTYAIFNKRRDLERALSRERDFVSLVSHQLRLPLTQLSWTMDAVFDDGSTPADLIEPVRDMKTIITQSAKLVNDLLNVSRIDRGVLKMTCEETTLAAIVTDTLRAFQSAATEKDVRFDVDVPKTILVFVDPQKAVEALRNVIDNALKYGPRGSVITIAATADERAKTASLFVIDKGPGIPQELGKRIFEKSSAFSKKGSGEGAGLGLYLTKNFIELMGGSVTFTSSEKGTTFVITLPTTITSACATEMIASI